MTHMATPQIKRVRCLRRCASRRRARAGSTLKVSGSGFKGVRKAVFHGSYGGGDDVSVRVRVGSGRRVHVKVPFDALTGPISLRVNRRVRSRRSKVVKILPAPPPEPNPTLTPAPGPRQAGAPRIMTGTSRTKTYFGRRKAVQFSYKVASGRASSATVQLIRARDGAVVKVWSNPPAATGSVQTIVWSGKLGRKAARNGRYLFRFTARGANGALARSASTTDPQRDAFDLYSHIFPVRGRHDYGGSGAQYGAGRGGRSHQGHDVFAKCGKKLVAARAGRVQYSGYHGAAGNYIVIDGTATNVDYAYMHLAEPSPFREGDKVSTGQRIGAVGETGNAHGCHLHFELWRGGWYEGGSAFDPEPSLRLWDTWS